MQGEIIGIGAANVDIMGQSRKRLVMEDSNPGILTVSVGGVTRNICENTARLGMPTRLITTVGDDDYGARIRRHCKSCGIHTESFITLPGETSSSYISIHQDNGEMAVALSDMHILQKLTPAQLDKQAERLKNAFAIVIDGCLAEETLAHIVKVYGRNVPVFADTVSTAYARRMKPHLAGIHTLKPNRLEAEILSGISIKNEADFFHAGEAIVKQGVERVVISSGAKGCFYIDRTGQMCWGRTKPLSKVENATGAGDSFMAGLLWSWNEGSCVSETLDFAMGAAVVALRSRTTINPKISADLIRRTIKELQP